MNELLHFAIKAAFKAGEEIISIYNTADFKIEFKADNSPLTIADKKSHDIIVAFIEKTNLPILSEEGKSIDYSERKTWDKFWLIDPLDGTKEFIKRNGDFTVNIALIENGNPTMGVIYVPVSKELYYADNEGAFKLSVEDSVPIEIQLKKAIKLPIPNKHETYNVVGSRSHMSAETETFISDLDSKGKNVEVISKGSSLKFCLVAEGTAQIYPRLAPTMEWDTAAGHAIAKYAGKNVSVYDTKQALSYNKENLLNPWFVVI